MLTLNARSTGSARSVRPALPPPEVTVVRPRWRDLGAASGAEAALQRRLDVLTDTRRIVPRGQPLFSSGDRMNSVFEVHTGVFKSLISMADGRVQITGFQTCGDLLGLDGIGSGRHAFDAVAVECSLVCAIPYAALTNLMKQSAELQNQFHRLMSGEIARDQSMLLMLGTMQAEERVARFLLEMLQRPQASGCTSSSLILGMSREEIGSYLGLTLETVSRMFSRLACHGVLEIKHRHVSVRDAAALRACAHQVAH